MVKVYALALLALASLSEAANILQIASGPLPGKPYTFKTLNQLLSPSVLGEAKSAALTNILAHNHITLFAPTDAAFDELLKTVPLEAIVPITDQVLSYHVSETIVDHPYLAKNPSVYLPTLLGNSSLASIKPQVVLVEASGKNVSLTFGFGKKAMVIDSVIADNGIIHVIDTVLVPASNATTTLTAITKENIPGIAFNSLAGALTKYKLADAVDTVTPITVFAPLDSAFAKLAPALVGLNDSVLDSAYPSILKYHVIAGAAAYVPPSGSYKTLNEESVTIVNNATTKTITVNGIPVIATVILSNGVAHVLGDVLVPDSISKALAAIAAEPKPAPAPAPVAAAGSTAAGSAPAAAVARSSAGRNAASLLAVVGAGFAMLA